MFHGNIGVNTIAHFSLFHKYSVVRVVYEDVIRIDCCNFAVNVFIFGCKIDVRRVAEIECLKNSLNIEFYLSRRRFNINLLQFLA